MKLPPTLMDPISQHDLASELHMTVAELLHGRGTPPLLYEVARDWPLYWAYKARAAEREAEKREGQRS